MLFIASFLFTFQVCTTRFNKKKKTFLDILSVFWKAREQRKLLQEKFLSTAALLNSKSLIVGRASSLHFPDRGQETLCQLTGESLSKLATSQLASSRRCLVPNHWLCQGRSLEGIYITAHPFTYAVSDYIPSLCAGRTGARSLLKGEQIPANRA